MHRIIFTRRIPYTADQVYGGHFLAWQFRTIILYRTPVKTKIDLLREGDAASDMIHSVSLGWAGYWQLHGVWAAMTTRRDSQWLSSRRTGYCQTANRVENYWTIIHVKALGRLNSQADDVSTLVKPYVAVGPEANFFTAMKSKIYKRDKSWETIVHRPHPKVSTSCCRLRLRYFRSAQYFRRQSDIELLKAYYPYREWAAPLTEVRHHFKRSIYAHALKMNRKWKEQYLMKFTIFAPLLQTQLRKSCISLSKFRLHSVGGFKFFEMSHCFSTCPGHLAYRGNGFCLRRLNHSCLRGCSAPVNRSVRNTNSAQVF